MSVIRSQLLADAREFADATNSGRWLEPFVLRRADVVFQREWRNILNANRNYRVGVREVVVGAGGVILASDLNAGSADTAELLYRVITVAVGDSIHVELPMDRVPGVHLSTEATSGQAIYWMQGADIVVRPASVGTTAKIVVNHVPPRPTTLVGDNSVVQFPDGYEDILALELAALLLLKGGAESQAARDLQREAKDMRDDLLADVSRLTTNPTQMRYSDSASEWAG